MANKGKQERLTRLNRRIAQTIEAASAKHAVRRYLKEGLRLPQTEGVTLAALDSDVANLEFKLMTLLDDRFALQQEIAEEAEEVSE